MSTGIALNRYKTLVKRPISCHPKSHQKYFNSFSRHEFYIFRPGVFLRYLRKTLQCYDAIPAKLGIAVFRCQGQRANSLGGGVRRPPRHRSLGSPACDFWLQNNAKHGPLTTVPSNIALVSLSVTDFVTRLFNRRSLSPALRTERLSRQTRVSSCACPGGGYVIT